MNVTVQSGETLVVSGTTASGTITLNGDATLILGNGVNASKLTVDMVGTANTLLLNNYTSSTTSYVPTLYGFGQNDSIGIDTQYGQITGASETGTAAKLTLTWAGGGTGSLNFSEVSPGYPFYSPVVTETVDGTVYSVVTEDPPSTGATGASGPTTPQHSGATGATGPHGGSHAHHATGPHGHVVSVGSHQVLGSVGSAFRTASLLPGATGPAGGTPSQTHNGDLARIFAGASSAKDPLALRGSHLPNGPKTETTPTAPGVGMERNAHLGGVGLVDPHGRPGFGHSDPFSGGFGTHHG